MNESLLASRPDAPLDALGAVTRLAPAKINLALHVTGRRGDGYHLLDMLVAFASHGDLIRVTGADADGFSVGGRFAASVPPDGGNLVLKARDALRALDGRDLPPVAIHLEKNLPVASGIGGGSSDAAATLLALDRFWDLGLGFGQLAALGLTLVAVVVLSAILAGVLTSYAPSKISPTERFASPSLLHLLGTDHLGRDLFTRVLYGGRIALMIALGATLASLVVGVVLGLIAGYGPRWLDNIMLLVFDAVKSFPTVMLALTLVTLFGPSLYAVVLVVMLVNVPGYARIIRTQTLVLKSAEHVMAARSMGASATRILGIHILPNIIGPILILVSMDVPVVVAIEAGMSFLGLGVRPPTPSWGAILNDGFANIRDSYWIVIAGGLPIVLTTLGFTFLGETLRDLFDPRLKRRS